MPIRPSLGVFVDITSEDPAVWSGQLERARTLSELGHVELWLETLPATPAQRAVLRDLVSGFDVVVHGPFVGLSLATSWSELCRISLDRLEAASAYAAELGAHVMTVHPGLTGKFEAGDAVADRLVGALAELRRRTDGGPTVSVENMPCRRGGTVEGLVTLDQCRSLIELDPGVRVTLDVGHAVQNGCKHVQFLADNPAAVADIHLHDGFVGGSAHLRLGDAELDLADFAEGVRASGYVGFISLETVGWPDTADSFASASVALQG